MGTKVRARDNHVRRTPSHTFVAGMPYFNGYLYEVTSSGPGFQLKLENDGSLSVANTNSDGITYGFATGA